MIMNFKNFSFFGTDPKVKNQDLNEILYKKILEHLKKKIKKNSLSIRKLAANCEIDRTSLQRILKGAREPRMITLIRIVKNGLNMSLSDFFRDFD